MITGVVIIAAWATCGARPAIAQTTHWFAVAPTNTVPTFVGVGIFAGTDDSSDRIRAVPVSSRISLIDGGVRVTRRVAVGAEWLRPPDIATTFSTHIQNHTAVTEHEWALFVTVRGRIAANRRVAGDLLGGIGRIVENGAFTSSTSEEPGLVVTTGAVSEQGTALFVGADVSASVLPHVAVTGEVRLDRLSRTPIETNFLTFFGNASVVGSLGAEIRTTW